MNASGTPPIGVDRREHFPHLDGLRGIAAMAVVLHHFFPGLVLKNGQLAVDLFFILSGFVIAASYGGKLDGIEGRLQFLWGRCVRLYPMLVAGVSVGSLYLIMRQFNQGIDPAIYSSVALASLSALVLMPYMGSALDGLAFPVNPPIWSLLFEVIAYIIYCFGARRLSTPVLLMVVSCSMVTVALAGSLGGAASSDIVLGFPRVLAGFMSGVLLYRLRSAGLLPSYGTNLYVLGAVGLAIFSIPNPSSGWLYIPAFATLWLVVLGASNGRPSSGDRCFSFLGLVSYPVYLLHLPLLHIATAASMKVGLPSQACPLLAGGLSLAMPAIGWLVMTHYETPARRWLKQQWTPRQRRSSAKPDRVPVATAV